MGVGVYWEWSKFMTRDATAGNPNHHDRRGWLRTSASTSRGGGLKVIQLDFYRPNFYFLGVRFASFLVKHDGVNFSSADYIRVLYAQVFFTNLYRFLVEGFGFGILFFAIIK